MARRMVQAAEAAALAAAARRAIRNQVSYIDLKLLELTISAVSILRSSVTLNYLCWLSRMRLISVGVVSLAAWCWPLSPFGCPLLASWSSRLLVPLLGIWLLCDGLVASPLCLECCRAPLHFVSWQQRPVALCPDSSVHFSFCSLLPSLCSPSLWRSCVVCVCFVLPLCLRCPLTLAGLFFSLVCCCRCFSFVDSDQGCNMSYRRSRDTRGD